MLKSLLSFELSENGVRITENKGNEVKILVQKLFSDKKDFHYKQELTKIFNELDLKSKEYDDYLLTWFSQQTTLIPSNIFGESTPEEIFKACFNSEHQSYSIDYNRISELQVVNVYEIPDWVKSFFVPHFPRIVMLHEGSLLLKGITKFMSREIEVHVNTHENCFHLVIINQKEFVFYNIFEWTSEDDLLYYLSFTLQQMDLFGKQGKLFLYESFDSSERVIKEFFLKMKTIKEFSVLDIENTDKLIFKYHQYCV
jgi:hypothetical protein